jgi:hypothetical protein
VEIFSRDVPDALWDADLSWVIIESRDGFERAWREALAPASSPPVPLVSGQEGRGL